MRGGDAGVRQRDTRPERKTGFQAIARGPQDQMRRGHAIRVWRTFEADLDSASRDSEDKSARPPQWARRGLSANGLALSNRDLSAVPVGQKLKGISQDTYVYGPSCVQEGRQRVAGHSLKGIGAGDIAGTQRLAASDQKRSAQNHQSTTPICSHRGLPNHVVIASYPRTGGQGHK